jgi:DNA-binding SARP family transcriptional activator
MPSFHIQLLGDFCLSCGGKPAITVVQPRLQSLLAYLLFHRDASQSRQRLAFLFWPNSSEAQARTNLRQLLFHLRRSLPAAKELLLIEPNLVQWSPDVIYSADVFDFESELAQAASIAQYEYDSTEKAALHAAIQLYKGDLLPECYDDWIAPERERLRQAYIAALERLVLLNEAQRDYGAAIGQAERLLNCDPLRETTYRRLMRLHALSGDRASALRVYQSCAMHMERELGVEPDVRTREEYERLLKSDTPVSMRAPPESPRAPPVLIGRHREWDRLRNAWRWALTGQPTLVLISGEAGMGKTRLAEEILEWATHQGISARKTRAYAAEGELAFEPLIELLRVTLHSSGLPALGDVWLAELPRILPELVDLQKDRAGPKVRDGGGERPRLFEAMARAILGGEPSGEKELFLLFDDLQWCDRQTLEWLHYLLHYAHGAKLLILGTFRPEEVLHSHPLMTLLFDLRLREQLIELELEPLDRESVVALAEQIAGMPLSGTQVAKLYDYTEGNPLFVVETIRAWINHDKADGAVELLDANALGDFPTTSEIPPKIQSVILTRLQQLSPAARELASLAATIGRSFSFDVLVQASGSDEETIVHALDELWWRRLIRELGGNAYDFSHNRIREVIYSQVVPARRRLLHRDVAEAMEHLYAANLDVVSGQIAVHYEQAGKPEQAAFYHQRAARLVQKIRGGRQGEPTESRARAA